MKSSMTAGLFVILAAMVFSQDGGLDFTSQELMDQTIGPIKAEADKPQVMILPQRIEPEFKKYELDERSFINDILSTATHQQLNKRFKDKTFRIETSGND